MSQVWKYVYRKFVLSSTRTSSPKSRTILKWGCTKKWLSFSFPFWSKCSPYASTKASSLPSSSESPNSWSKVPTFKFGMLNLHGVVVAEMFLESFSYDSWGVLSPGMDISQKSSEFDMVALLLAFLNSTKKTTETMRRWEKYLLFVIYSQLP